MQYKPFIFDTSSTLQTALDVDIAKQNSHTYEQNLHTFSYNSMIFDQSEQTR